MECGEWVNLLRPFKQGAAILGRVVRGSLAERGVGDQKEVGERATQYVGGELYPPRAPYSTKTPVPHSHPWGPIGRAPLAA